VRQLQLFYSTLVRYADRHPEQTEWLLFGPRPTENSGPIERTSATKKDG
jgi:hypothetical protein